MSKYEYKEVIVTVHNFYQFQKPEWNKLVRAERECRNYYWDNKGNHRAMSGKRSSLHPN